MAADEFAGCAPARVAACSPAALASDREEEIEVRDGDNGSNTKKLSMIVTKGSLDWAYPPFILATTAAAMGLEVSMFFTFYGLTLLKKKLDLQVTDARQSGDGRCRCSACISACRTSSPPSPASTPRRRAMMKNLIKKKGVASIEELRDMAVEADVEMIACQMTMDLFEYTMDDMIEGPVLGGAATYIENATKSDINLFI